ncbi:MAG: type II secretion system F family protein [Gammaproteobacteria bacterium]|nr:type II secretion system F family protein [Gammaproteobacteria bacterium]
MAFFTRQLATMLRSGVTLVQAFDIVAAGAEKPSMASLVREIRNDVSTGESFATALRRHPAQFDSLYCNLVDAGERAGASEAMLDRIATHREKTEGLKSKVRKAMVYPIAVICVALAVSGILLVKVVPQFEQIFAGFGAELPAATRLVIAVSEFAQAWWLPVLAAAAALLAGTLAARRSRHATEAMDRIVLRLPIIGGIARKSAVARCARTMATTISAGVPLIEALNSVAASAGNSVFAREMRRVRDEVAGGRQISAAMRNNGVFPVIVVQMIAVGEESGTLDDMLDRSAAHYEAQVDNAVEGLTSLLEPMIMSVLGVLIGGLVIAMYLPIFQLGAVAGGI